MFMAMHLVAGPLAQGAPQPLPLLIIATGATPVLHEHELLHTGFGGS